MSSNGYVGLPYNLGSDTSKEAAESMVPSASTIREWVLSYVRAQARFGGTTCDAAEVALKLTHQTCSARFNDLKKERLIFDSGKRTPTRSGRKAAVYLPVINL